MQRQQLLQSVFWATTHDDGARDPHGHDDDHDDVRGDHGVRDGVHSNVLRVRDNALRGAYGDDYET